MKQDLMNNAIYNEYNVEELETTFRYVRDMYYDVLCTGVGDISRGMEFGE